MVTQGANYREREGKEEGQIDTLPLNETQRERTSHQKASMV